MKKRLAQWHMSPPAGPTYRRGIMLILNFSKLAISQ